MVSIKTKLVAIIYASILLSAATLSCLSIMHLTKSSRRNAMQALKLTSLAEREHLDVTMGNVEQSVNTMRDLMTTKLSNVNRFVNDDEYQLGLTRDFEQLFYHIAYHTNGAVSFYVRYNPELIHYDNNPGFLWANRKRGANFVPITPTDIAKYDKNDTEHVGWYYGAATSRKATWILPYEDKNVGAYMISYVTPLFIGDTLIGVVGMDIDFTIIVSEMNRILPYRSGYAYITDKDSKIIYHKDYENGSKEIKKDRNAIESEIQLKNGWFVYVTASKAEINAGRNRMTSLYIIVTLLFTSLFAAAGAIMARKIVKPLIELTDATKKIAAGDLNVHITTDSTDEIGILADAFRKTLKVLPDHMYKDPLTGIRNSAAYKQEVKKLEARHSGNDAPFGVCVFDVNNLKQTNDFYGHEVGNQLIINATHLICRIFAHSPVFRIGGDEFVVILERSDYVNRSQLLQSFELESHNATFSAVGITFPVSVAFGVAVYQPEKHEAYVDVFNRADDCMYENKKASKQGRKN